MPHIVFGAAPVNDEAVPDSSDRFCVRRSAELLHTYLGTLGRIAEHGDLYKLVRFESGVYIVYEVFVYAVFAYMKDRIEILCNRAQFCALSACYHNLFLSAHLSVDIDNEIISCIFVSEVCFERGLNVVVRKFAFIRNYHIEYQIAVRVSAYHSEIVQGKIAV